MAQCPLCGGADTTPLYGPRAPWHYQCCRSCGHAWLIPQPSSDELRSYYNSGYVVPRERYLETCARRGPALRRLVHRFHPVPGRLLEIGCSYGAMLDVFARAAWSVEGVEVDARAATFAKEYFGLAVHHGQLSEVRDRLSPPYDVITLYHVIEHVLDPRALVAELHAMLAPSGVLVVKTPNVQSLIARLTGGWWEWCAPPEHVHLFSPVSLARLLEQTGFRPPLVRTQRGDAHTTLFELIRATSKRLLGGGGTGAASRPNETPARERPWYIAIDHVSSIVGSPLEWGLRLIAESRIAAGPELLVIAQRR